MKSAKRLNRTFFGNLYQSCFKNHFRKNRKPLVSKRSSHEALAPRKAGFRITIGVTQFFIRLILKSCNVHFLDNGNFAQATKKGRFIFTMWHEKLALVEPLLANYATPNAYTIIAGTGRKSNLVEKLAKNQKGAKVVRVPAQQKHLALQKITDALSRNEVVLQAADHSMGPSHQAKPEIAFAAHASCAPIIPFSFASSSFWEMKQWKGVIIPKPFSTVVLGVGKEIMMTEDDPEKGRKTLTDELLQLDFQIKAKLRALFSSSSSAQ